MTRSRVLSLLAAAWSAGVLGAGCATATGEGPIASAHLERVPGPILPLPPPAAAAPTPASALAASVAPCPPSGSDEAKADLAIVLWLQRTRSAADVARSRSEIALDLRTFSEALGPAPGPAAQPRTRALLTDAQRRTDPVVAEAKRRFDRPRPYDADPRVAPAVERERSSSYPSGHATRGVVLARVLAELVPGRREALLQVGLRIGYDRVVGGVHYPTDVTAGQQLGAAIADVILADPEFRRAVDAVRAAEWLTARPAVEHAAP